ncbi:unnamed protein product (macronuclear) [Paramecium tetraurelia]|uniref:Protein-tyrosine-phosphatase n=1 Tax=Paramecium tetraurelia TaxID=5888 RepID=A0BK58_PARTE|nr:uncharacterized protein GSPATT00029555001 [Paramecium tetraurelia]CAK58925.1 unnamed protein product [Paramecium tetraurelia]|eukprot:XP_001426323.1 hypothetical protein (macronuclear) [Paramecium tetraurelia strain d4-2]
MQINFCTPQYFFNISQKYPFIVYDLREHQHGFLKNSIHVTNIHQVETVEDVQKHFQYPDQQSEKKKLEKLFQTRKRNYNFFVPFDTSDMFSLLLKDRIKGEGSEISDQFCIPLESVAKWCHEISKKLPYKQKHKIRSRANTMIMQDDDDELVDTDSQQTILHFNKHQTIASSKKVIELQEITISNGPKIKQRSVSQPKCIGHGEGSLYMNSELFGAALKIYEIYHKDKVRQLFIMLDPIQIVFGSHSFLNYEISKNRGFLDKTFPNEIIENKLYLGGGDHAQDTEMLVDILGITHVVNATIEIKNYCDQLKYLNIKIYDEPHIEVKQYFEDVYQFIENALQMENGKVFVHCAQGKSRSACFIVMYLMRKFSWGFEKAYEFVRECREVVCINEGFINQLIELN